MSRKRYKLTIHLRTDSPLHSGGVDEVADPSREGVEREVVARRFARDAHGEPVLTGRSVKGAVRAACAQYLAELPEGDALGRQLREAERSLWGDQRGAPQNSAPLRASALTFRTVKLPQTAVKESQQGQAAQAGAQQTAGAGEAPGLPQRMGNAIDRRWGTVGDGALFAHEFLPRGHSLTLVVTAEAATETAPASSAEGDAPVRAGAEQVPPMATTAQVEQVLALIVGLFQAERICFGGRQGAGWGRVVLDADHPYELRAFEPTSRAGLRAFLAEKPQAAELPSLVDCAAPARTRIEIEWDSPTGILVADPGLSKQEKVDRAQERRSGPQEGCDAVPAMPLRDSGGDDGPLVLPGSSVRGALRGRASRIGRTVLANSPGPHLRSWEGEGLGVHEQLADDPALVRDLFGTTERRGALRVLDTLTAQLRDRPRRVTHNACDRWTGGVAEGALFCEELYDKSWNKIVLELDASWLQRAGAQALGSEARGADRAKAAFCLLGLVLAELATGTLPLGGKGTRGLGQVEVRALHVQGLEWLGLGSAEWHLGAAAEAQRPGQAVARELLARLREVNKTITANDGAREATGWSAYLVETAQEEQHG
ncbi:RAMP superfamily CRISPR-associated protein [Actinomyces weissii]|uniref:CRISPR-associated protein n=1 Tax=Actinomyces weissii TaxID=675090 RepID=A0A7T7MAA3_9ACTO|nr:RAMP superfamily CRISPR-associated protein [Actinomyces weissii]QQM67645.1 CRISPR-associated protein [Actinomyces weissii]